MSSSRRGCRRDDVNNPTDAVDAVDMIGSNDADAVGGSINPSSTAASLTRHDGSLCQPQPQQREGLTSPSTVK